MGAFWLVKRCQLPFFLWLNHHWLFCLAPVRTCSNVDETCGPRVFTAHPRWFLEETWPKSCVPAVWSPIPQPLRRSSLELTTSLTWCNAVKIWHDLPSSLASFFSWNSIGVVWLHYINTLHCIALHCVALHYMSLHDIALHVIAWHCITCHCMTLHYVTLH